MADEKKAGQIETSCQGDQPMPILLAIGYVWPEPDSSAAGAHMLSLLRLFHGNGWRVIFASPAQKTEHMIDLATQGIASESIQLNDSSFDQFIGSLMPNMVLFDRFMMEEQFAWRVEKACPTAIRVLDTEDLQCLRQARQTALKAEQTFHTTDIKKSELAKREVAAILRSDLSLIISDYEMDLLQSEFNLSASLLHHLPFMLDLESLNLDELATRTPSFESRQHFVTIGNFRHAPNWDSVLYLQTLWPEIRRQLPEAELHIYGAYPPKKATQLNNPKTGFLIKGWAEDAHEVLANARVCLAPLRFGAGIKGKLIDAMRSGTPSVTTPIGVEGMLGDATWPGIIGDDAESIVAAAVSLYRNQQQWLSCQQKISQLLPRYDGALLGPALLDKINDLSERLQSHRDNNFIGAMLRHHSMKSTEYMSRWIETKTQLAAHKESQ